MSCREANDVFQEGDGGWPRVDVVYTQKKIWRFSRRFVLRITVVRWLDASTDIVIFRLSRGSPLYP